MNALIVALLSLGGVHYDTSIGSCMPLSGGTFTSAVCWTDGTQSVCVDSPAAGDFQIYGSGGTNNEDLTIDTETTANVLGLSSSTGVTDIDLGTLQLLFGAGATLKPGSTDDVLCLEESGDATDQVCMKVVNDALQFFQGDESTKASLASGTVATTGYFTATASTGGVLYLTDATAPGVNDALASAVYSRAYNDASSLETYAQVEVYTDEVTDGDEDGKVSHRVMENGSMTTFLELTADDTYPEVAVYKNLTIGTGGQWAQGSTDDVICLQERDTAADQFCMKTSGDAAYFYQGDEATWGDTNAGNTIANGYFLSERASGGAVYLADSSAPGVNNAVSGVIYFRAKDDGSNNTYYAQIAGYTEEVTDGDEDGSLFLQTMNNGSMTTVVNIDATDGVEKVSFAWPLDVTGGVTLSGALTMSGVVNPGDSNYTTVATSNWIAMATACTASRTITLDDDHCVTGRVITITDAGCGAAANNIIVDPEGASHIQGADGTYTMSTDDESIDVGCVDGSGGTKKWWVR